jgi:hypothetical protein
MRDKLKINEMAKQNGIHGLKGTIDELTYYEAFGQLLVKRKGGLDPEKVKRNKKRYSKRIQCAQNFGKAAEILKSLYRRLPIEERKHGLFGKLTGMANQMLHKGMAEEKVATAMEKYLTKEYGLLGYEEMETLGVRNSTPKEKIKMKGKGIFSSLKKLLNVLGLL